MSDEKRRLVITEDDLASQASAPVSPATPTAPTLATRSATGSQAEPARLVARLTSHGRRHWVSTYSGLVLKLGTSDRLSADHAGPQPRSSNRRDRRRLGVLRDHRIRPLDCYHRHGGGRRGGCLRGCTRPVFFAVIYASWEHILARISTGSS